MISKLQSSNSRFNDLAYDFFDGTFNASYQVNRNNHFSYAAFASGDDFGFGIKRFDVQNGMNWKNQTHSLASMEKFLQPEFLSEYYFNEQ